MRVGDHLLMRCNEYLERVLAEAGDEVDMELVQLQHDIVQYDRGRTDGPPFITSEADWDFVKQR